MPDDNNRTPGIDISHWSGGIDWDAVQADGKVFYCIPKATGGNSLFDPNFDANWLGLRRIGMIRGAYHFLRPQFDAVEQAKHYLRIMTGILHSTDLPPVLDVEYWPEKAQPLWDKLTRKERIAMIRAWLDHVEAAVGRKPIIYTSRTYWNTLTGGDRTFTDYRLWVAQYEVDAPNLPAKEWGGNGYMFWQWSDDGVIKGIKSEVDLNWYSGTFAELKDEVGFTGTRPLPPEVTNLGMLVALRKAATDLGLGQDDLVAKAEASYLLDPRNRERPYNGLALEEMDLAKAERDALKAAIGKLGEGLAVTLSGITNQDIINAFYAIANGSGMTGWDLITMAGLQSIAADRPALYKGPGIGDLPKLSEAQKDALLAALGLAPAPAASRSMVTYPGFTNQDMIDLFYKVAVLFDTDGWKMIDRADLEEAAASTEARRQPYSGPPVEALPNLSDAEKTALKLALEALLDPA